MLIKFQFDGYVGSNGYCLFVIDSPDRLSSSFSAFGSSDDLHSVAGPSRERRSDISASFLSDTFQERHQLQWPVPEEVEEIDFDLKEVSC